jgi:uncharacterized protein YfaS (alpha-2-macroglobulin family)
VDDYLPLHHQAENTAMMRNHKNLLCALLVTLIILGAFSPVLVGEDQDKGLQLRLSEGAERQDRQPPSAPPASLRLSESDAQTVLKRLPSLKMEAGDEQDFVQRERSLPPPRAGQTVVGVFPPPQQSAVPTNAAPGPLEVLRYAPEGDVAIAPHLSVSFSQPMVAVTSHGELAAQDVPVRLTPQPPGKWRWIGTRTLRFEPENRFPMATEYAVEVPAGTRSVVGVTLATAKTWRFTTSPVQVNTTYPNGSPHPHDPLIFVQFDQRVDPAALLSAIQIRSGSLTWKARLATPAEIEADADVRRLVNAARQGYWLAFRAVDSANANSPAILPAGATITVSIGPGAPSAEGPRRTAAAQEFSFKTYGSLRVAKHECTYDESQKECEPFSEWEISFSNDLDAEAFQPSQVRVAPPLPEMKTEIRGSTLAIRGQTRSRTTYTVTVDAALRDQFDQTLGRNLTIPFKVGAMPTTLMALGERFVVLDPFAPPHFSVFSVNHRKLRVRVYAVGPQHWQPFVEYMQQVDNGPEDMRRKPPGRLVLSKTIRVKGPPDEIAETRIDLSPALADGFGQTIIIVEPATPVRKIEDREWVRAWVQVTGIGLDAFVDKDELIGWATSLKDGRPLAGAEMTVLPVGISGTTGADGLARFALTTAPEQQGANLLVVRKGPDLAILPENIYEWKTAGGWHRKEDIDSLRWYVFDDRAMYRPGEEVHIKGWIRRVAAGKHGDIGLPRSAATQVTYLLKDPRDNEILKGTCTLNALGGFDTVLRLPSNMNLGYATLVLDTQDGTDTVKGCQYAHRFQVQEFRRPEFKVSAAVSQGPHFVGGHADLSVSAAYYAGGGLPQAQVEWAVTSFPASFTPPNRGDFAFGTGELSWSERRTEERSKTFSGQTNALGEHRLRIDFDSVDPPRPTSITAQVGVTDVNRQAWRASASLLVHPADLYVGLRSERAFVQKGEPLVVQAIVTDLDGKAVAGRAIRMRAVQLEWTYKKNKWQQQETNPQACSATSASEPVHCSFETKAGGAYRVVAIIEDNKGRPNQSELRLWVAGGMLPPNHDMEQEKVDLIADRKEYQPGDVAQLLVQAPFYPAEGVLTLRRSGIVHTERFTMDGPSYTLKVPIREDYFPNVHVQVDLVGKTNRNDVRLSTGPTIGDKAMPPRPAFANGTLDLSVPPRARRLSVAAIPRETALAPGGQTVIDITVQDAAGNEVAGSEVAVVVVDEAILALTRYQLVDPLAAFYIRREAEVSDYYLREYVLLASPGHWAVAFRKGTGGGAGSGVAGMSSAISVRADFNPLATFAAAVPTDAQGRAQVPVKLPDNLTRYRVMAVAVSGGQQFGHGESAITARLPLMVRPSAPRFLNFGDRIELPVVVQNQTDAPLEVDVALRVGNLELTGGSGQRVTVPANNRVEVRFPTATARAGTARFQVGAAAGPWSDAAEIELPVWSPATTEAFATYGEIDEGATAQPVKAPSGVVPQFGGLEITTSSTQLQALTDAVLYLMAYPFECSEQLASRVLAVAALRDVLTAFEAKGLPPPEEMVAAVARDVKRLQGLQNSDGGFAFWRRGDESWPYLSIHAAHALQRAKEKGFTAPAEMLDLSRRYLRDIEQHIPSSYPSKVRPTLVAYALYVRHRMGDRDAARARALIREVGLDQISLEAVGWLLAVLSGDPDSQAELSAIRQHLNNRVEETAAAAHFTTSYRDGAHLLLHSERRADGVLLEALIDDQPNSDLISKIVRGLLAQRKRGRWSNTQENAFILLALDRYFATYEKATPDFVARAWLGEQYAGEHQFRGRTTERHHVSIPMRYLSASSTAQNLILNKVGTGRLYYRVGMQYAPASLRIDALDRGFTVERAYEAVDDPGDVRRNGDGVWRVKAGARVRVRLTMVAPARRYHVALVDPLPAGLEPLNPALAVTGSIPQDPKAESATRGAWWTRAWFEHQNLRDDRVEAFTSLLWEGVYEYTYVARATTPGIFVVPPTKAEEMYQPETFGRGASDRVIVE